MMVIQKNYWLFAFHGKIAARCPGLPPCPVLSEPGASRQPPGCKILKSVSKSTLSMRWSSPLCSPSSPALPLRGTYPGTAWAWGLFELLLIYLVPCQFIFKCTESLRLRREEHQPKCFQQRLGLAEFLTILKLTRNSFGGFTLMLSLVVARFILIYHYFYNKKWFSLCPRVNCTRCWRDPYCHANKMQKSPFSLPAWEVTAAESRDCETSRRVLVFFLS